MTLLTAMRARDGTAIVPCRKEGLPNRAGREATECRLDAGGRLCLSLSGGARVAKFMLVCIRDCGFAGLGQKTSELAASIHDRHQCGPSAEGILVMPGIWGLEIYGILARDGHATIFANNGASSMHGAHAAIVPCRRLAKDPGIRSLSCDAAAAHLHVLASSVAETVDSVGKRDKYGFDLVLMKAAGEFGLLSRPTDVFGTITVQFRMDGAGAAPAAAGDEV